MPVGWNWTISTPPETFLNGGPDRIPSLAEARVTRADSQAPGTHWDPLGQKLQGRACCSEPCR